jgi:CHAT domain-containing protein/Tfp pilus assembly protein PilF
LFLNKKALQIAGRINNLKEESRCLNNIGVYYYGKNCYSKALTYYEQALYIRAEDAENDIDLSSILNNIGAIYRELGEYEKAIINIRHALEIDRSLNDFEGMAVELRNLAATHRRKAVFSKNANDIYLCLMLNMESLEIARKIGNKRYEVEAMNNIGLAYAANKNYSQALEYFRCAIKGAMLIEHFSEACNVYANMGFTLIDKEDYEEAESSFRKGLDLVLQAKRYDVLWEIYFGLGQCLEKIGRCDAALICYGKATDTIDFMRSRLALDDYKAGFIRDKMKAYEALLNLLSDRKEKEKTADYDREIFEVIEKAKARAFLEELENDDRSNSNPADQEYKNQEAYLSKKMSLTISELIRPGLGEVQRRKLLTRLELEEDKHMSLLNRIKTEAAEHSGIAPPQVISANRIQEEHLDGSSAILEYYLGEKKSFGILITKNSFVLRVLPARTEIENSIRAYLRMISTPPAGSFKGILAARRIYRELVFPFQEAISRDIDHLIFIPDGILHYLPFETLVRDDAKNARPRYLLELYDVSYAPSLSSLVYLMEKQMPGQHRKTLLLVGDPIYIARPSKTSGRWGRHEDALRDIYLDEGFEFSSLPYSKREIRQVARCFQGDEVDVLSESQAKEDDIKSRLLEEYQIIHFACHGFLDEKTPRRSALVLTLDDDPNEDGFLQAREISNLRLSADLVVLSACQTGKGRLENGEGVLGLPRSFFYAGARSTISSLWKVNDKSTSKIMPDFYRYLAAGYDKARALSLAKRNMLNSRLSHPFYWAAFVLNGDYLSSRR